MGLNVNLFLIILFKSQSTWSEYFSISWIVKFGFEQRIL